MNSPSSALASTGSTCLPSQGKPLSYFFRSPSHNFGYQLQNWIQLGIGPIGKVLEETLTVGCHTPWGTLTSHFQHRKWDQALSFLQIGIVILFQKTCPENWSQAPTHPEFIQSWIHSGTDLTQRHPGQKAVAGFYHLWAAFHLNHQHWHYVHSFPKERCCHPLSWAQHWNEKLSS